jgi:uncharacterized membrane protein (DUF373 family)
MTLEQELSDRVRRPQGGGGNVSLRKYLEISQDVIVLAVCIALFVAMLIKLVHLARELLGGTDFSIVTGEILFILVLMELFRLLVIYLEDHSISVATMVEVGIVATLREVILRGVLQVEWRQMLVLCAFVLTLGVVLRYAGVREPRNSRNLRLEKAPT